MRAKGELWRARSADKGVLLAEPKQFHCSAACSRTYSQPVLAIFAQHCGQNGQSGSEPRYPR
jgi:hypothetical protein